MKPKTIILLVICGSLLLLVGVFAVFFARGGEVLYWGKMESSCTGPMIEANEAVAKEIAKMDFTYSPIPALTVRFQGRYFQNLAQFRQESEPNSGVIAEIRMTGKALRAFPSRRVYYGISAEEYLKLLTQEIQSRIPEDSEFHLINDVFLICEPEHFHEYPERFRQKN